MTNRHAAHQFPPGMYCMNRTTDMTGVSGTGVVAEVAIFSNGKCVVCWTTGKDSVVVWDKIQDMLDVHINCYPDTSSLLRVSGVLGDRLQ